MKALRLRTSLRRLYLAVLIVQVFLVGIPGLRLYLAGFGVVLLGRVLQAWSSGHLHKVNERRGPDPAVPTTSGPYAHVRNPIAWSSLCADVGYGIAAGATIPLAIYGLIHVWIATRRIILYEEPMLRRRCGEAYDTYSRAVPRFLPRLSPYPGPEGRRFSFRHLWENGEASRLLGALSLLGFFRVIWVVGRGGPGEAPDLWPVLVLASILGAASLVLQSFEYRPHLTRRRILRWLRGEGRSSGPGDEPAAADGAGGREGP